MRSGVCVFVGFVLGTALAAASRVPPGTRVKLVVQATLSTRPAKGVLNLLRRNPTTPENGYVLYAVAEDVRDADGNVVIPAGSPATGAVVASEPGGGLHAEPPRLAVTVENAMGSDGKLVPLRFETVAEGKWAHRFSRAETGAFAKQMRRPPAPKLVSSPMNSAGVRELTQMAVDGDLGDLLRHPSGILALKYLAERSGLSTFVRFVQEGKVVQVAALLAQLESGSFALHSVADVKSLRDVVELTQEAWRSGAQLTTWMGRHLVPPQIVVPAGFPVEAVVVE